MNLAKEASAREIQELKTKIKDLETQLESKEKEYQLQIVGLQGDLTTLNEKFTTKHTEHEELQEKLGISESEWNAKLTSATQEKEALIQRYEEQIETKTKGIVHLNNKIAELEAEI